MKMQTRLGFPRSFLLVTALVAAGACTKKAAPPSPTAAAPVAAPGEKAMAKPTAPATEIDLGKLDEAKRKVFDQVVEHEPSACGKGHSLIDSLKRDPACRASFYAVRYIARLAETGAPAAEIGEKLEQRFRTPRVPYIDVSQAPSKGDPKGRVAVVEFADYTCGHCKEAQALLPTLLANYPKDVTFYFKHYPLGGSVGGLNAAIGAVGAQKQGKFWEFSDKVWENSERLSPAVLEGIAKEVGLAFDRWYADLGSEEIRGHVLRDRTEARTLEIRRTPAFFINGRKFTDEVDVPSLQDWIDEELGR